MDQARIMWSPAGQADHVSVARKIKTAFALTSLVLLTACARLPTYSYEVTVEVETPEGLRTGSSVIEVRSRSEPRLLPDMRGHSSRVIGEAVVVDMPNGQTLFATLEGENPTGSAELMARATLLSRPDRGSLSYAEQVSRLSEMAAEGVVDRASYPLLVRFRDLRVPETLEGVDPENLSGSFGEGVALRRIVVRSTNAEPTFAIHFRLPWLNQNPRLISRASNGVRIVLRTEDFQRK